MVASSVSYFDENDVFDDRAEGVAGSVGDTDRLTDSLEKGVTSVTARQIETVVRFSHRIFSFPFASPPPTPTKPGQGNRLGSSEVGFPRTLNKEQRLSFNDLEISSSLRNIGWAEQGLGISILEESGKRSTLTPPATPKLKQDFQFASYQLKFSLTPLKSPNGTLVINKNSNDNGFQFVNVAERGGETTTRSKREATLHSNNTEYQFPPTPPTTPKEAHLKFTEDVETVLSTDIFEDESASEGSAVNMKVQTLAETPLIGLLTLSLLYSVNAPKPSCSDCTYFPVDTQVFVPLANVFTHQLPELKGHFQLHPALITHIIALVPASTAADHAPRFFATKLNSKYQEIDFHTLIRYQKFRKDGFQIECFSHCRRHSGGYTVWKFLCRETFLISCGEKTKVLSPLQMARHKQGALVRKLSYYAR